MNKHVDEARLERSLARQVSAPQLDRRFNAAVWARIEAEESADERGAVSAQSPASRVARWLFASNLGGFIVAAILVAYFGARMLGGVEIDVPAPALSPAQSDAVSQLIVWGFTVGALVFGLMFTPLGRRLRSELT